MNTTTESNGTDPFKNAMTEAMQSDEAEFTRLLPTGQWLLVKLEPLKKLSAILTGPGTEIRSPYAIVIAVGPEFRADVQPGDRVTYAECLNLPKEIGDVSWTRHYKWVHENKFLARQPRNTDEKQMAKPKPAASATPAEVEASQQFLATAKNAMHVQGMDPDTGKRPVKTG